MARVRDAGVLLWSDPYQSIARSSKLFTYSHLRWIAEEITKTECPVVFRLSNPMEYVKRLPSNIILKKGFSNGTTHSFFKWPGQDSSAFREVFEWGEDMYRDENWRKHGIVPLWFGMQYMTHIVELGEYQLFFFGGKCVHSIVTKPMEDGNLAVEPLEGVTPLELIRWVVVFGVCVSFSWAFGMTESLVR